MNKTIHRCIVICAVAAYFIIALVAPWVLSDRNQFLRDFLDSDLLQLLGVIVAITLASAANIHLEFNKIEDCAKQEILVNSRRALRRSAYLLLLLFAAAVVLVVTKPLLPTGETATALVNGAALLVVLVSILVLVDLTRLVFRIEPMFKMFPTDD